MEKKNNAVKGNVTVNVLSTFDAEKEAKTGKSVLLVEVDYEGNNAINREQLWFDVKDSGKVSETPYHVFTGRNTPNYENATGRLISKGLEKKTRFATLEEALKALATKVSATTKKATEKKVATVKKATVKKVTEKGVKTA